MDEEYLMSVLLVDFCVAFHKEKLEKSWGICFFLNDKKSAQQQKHDNKKKYMRILFME